MLKQCTFVWKLMNLWCFSCVILDLLILVWFSFWYSSIWFNCYSFASYECWWCVLVRSFYLFFCIAGWFLQFELFLPFFFFFFVIDMKIWLLWIEVNFFFSLIVIKVDFFFSLHEQWGFLNISHCRIVFRVCNCLIW